MNMNVLFFIEIMINAVFVGLASDKADCRHCRFLHNVAERACKFNLARSVKDCRLYLKHFASYARPCKSVYNADFGFLINRERKIFFRSEQLFKVGFLDGKRF